MSDNNINEPMLDMFIFETSQLIEQLEQTILESEKESCITESSINEIFRIMHTIKGSSAMMTFNGIASLAHSIEDLFFFLREEKPKIVDFTELTDLIFEGIDFIKIEVEKIKHGDFDNENAVTLLDKIKNFLSVLKAENNSLIPKEVTTIDLSRHQNYIKLDNNIDVVYRNYFKAVIYFEDGCEMENVRAYTIIHNLKALIEEFYYIPEDILDSDGSLEVIRQEGFQIFLKTDYSYEEMYEFFQKTIFLKDLELIQLENEDEFRQSEKEKHNNKQDDTVKISALADTVQPEAEHIDKDHKIAASATQSIISVNVAKLDKLMDLVGEMVISEAMVIQNPDLQGLELDNFKKAARQLNKITSDIQNMVMSIRMVPLSATFQKMHRIIRDMSKKLNKEIRLEIIGDDTEVDKNIIEHISDPLMHLVRNAADHGIEPPEERISKGKPKEGTITLEAKNAGSDVLIIVKDDGEGLNKEKILAKARENGLIINDKNDLTDKEIFNLILLPGFSTNDDVTEFSGRGVGMDVVLKNIEDIGGSLSVESTEGEGTAITLKMPLTLAIIDGMNIRVGSTCYTIPTISIKESFRPLEKDIITDPDRNEMIMVRGKCYPILRLHRLFHVKTEITDFVNGIIIMVEQDEKTLCIFADGLLGQQQVVVKALPGYIQGFNKIKELAGCTLLGDGSISLILNISGLLSL